MSTVKKVTLSKRAAPSSSSRSSPPPPPPKRSRSHSHSPYASRSHSPYASRSPSHSPYHSPPPQASPPKTTSQPSWLKDSIKSLLHKQASTTSTITTSQSQEESPIVTPEPELRDEMGPIVLPDEKNDDDEEEEGEMREHEQSPASVGVAPETTSSSPPTTTEEPITAEKLAEMSVKGHTPSQPQLSTQRHIPSLHGCRNVDVYERLNTIDEGTYGVVHRARDKLTGTVVALKKIKLDDKQFAGFPITSLREINILLTLKHTNIVELMEMVVDARNPKHMFMVMEYMEHDVKVLMKSMRQPFRQAEVKCLMRQLLLGVEAMHNNWILHRDLKTSNLLMNNKGILKICDFGLARKYGDPIGSYTQLVVTLWYRAPELLLGTKTYGPAIDMWSIGCIMAEFLTREPLMPGKGEFQQLELMFKLLGTPNDKIWPGFSELPNAKTFKWKTNRHPTLREKFARQSFSADGIYLSDIGYNLLQGLLTYDPKKRLTATQALQHPWFDESPRAIDPSEMPTFLSSSEGKKVSQQPTALDSPDEHADALKHVKRDGDDDGFFLA